jgi:CubicO group peptidase (beta-lactamase class C family)
MVSRNLLIHSFVIMIMGLGNGLTFCFQASGAEPASIDALDHDQPQSCANQPKASRKRPDYTSLVARLQRDVPNLLKDNRVPGVAIALIDDQECVWAEGFGFASRAAKVRVTADTQFSLQSVTKSYTATAFLMAVDKKRFTLDEPIRKAVPGFRVHSHWGDAEVDKATFRHLLSHWGGLSHEAPIGNNYGDWQCTFDEHVRSISDTWLKCRVGERFRYSNLGYDLIGYALQNRAGKPFTRLMREDLLEPLGMTKSTFDQGEAMENAGRARGHIQGKEVPPLEVPMLGAGGLYSTARDMAKFVSFHLAGGVAKGRRLIAADLLRTMYTPQFTLPGQKAGYGLGVTSRPYHGAKLVFHGGGGYGYATDQRWVPEYGVGVVVLSNGEEGDNFVPDLADEALQAMILAKQGTLTPDEPLPWTREQLITPKPEELRRLEGSYLVGGQLTTFRLAGDQLHLVRGKRDQPLVAYSPTRFGRGGDLYEFLSDDRGRVCEVRNLGDNGVSFLIPNDSPRDPKGPAKAEWDRFLGAYHAQAYGQDDEKSITRKNGYLYWNDKLKLTEDQPGLFFTADGDSVQFGEDTVEYGSRHYRRVKKRSTDRLSFPGKSWETIDRPETVGWSSRKLARAKAYADYLDTAAVMVIVDGRELCRWGDVSAKFMMHSIRKSLLSALYGIAIKDGAVRLDKTLADLGIDDTAPVLTPAEKQATVRDLLRSRSGVYHPAALETPDMALARPPRDSHPPGSYWFYNNWDFNTLGTIFEKESGKKIFDTFKVRIAEPVQMEDFLVSDGEYQLGPESRHPGYPLRMSTRDLARFGLLYLRKGAWDDRGQLIPKEWVEESTRSHSDAGSSGYGYMWWVTTEEKSLPRVSLPNGSFWAWGTRGHYLVVVPALDLVVVHRVNSDVPGRDVSAKEFGRLLRLILDARE